MPFKPNYNQQRAERNRAKQAKKEAKAKAKKAEDSPEEEAADGEPVAKQEQAGKDEV